MFKIIICILAGLGAGLGTGFAGMSAAAVISPMLITFLHMDPYLAVGIALASDVLASAASAYTYGKNKNLDIKNGVIMMIHRQWRSRRYRHYYLSVRSVPRKDWLLPAHGGLAIRPCKYLRQLGRLPVFPPLLQLLRGNWCCQKTHHLILFITILPRYLGIVLPQYFIFPRLYILHGKYHCQCRNTQHCLRHQ